MLLDRRTAAINIRNSAEELDEGEVGQILNNQLILSDQSRYLKDRRQIKPHLKCKDVGLIGETENISTAESTLNDAKWKRAINDEMQFLAKIKTWIST